MAAKIFCIDQVDNKGRIIGPASIYVIAETEQAAIALVKEKSQWWYDGYNTDQDCYCYNMRWGHGAITSLSLRGAMRKILQGTKTSPRKIAEIVSGTEPSYTYDNWDEAVVALSEIFADNGGDTLSLLSAIGLFR